VKNIIYVVFLFNFLFATEYYDNYKEFELINPPETRSMYGNFAVIGNTVEGVTKCKRIYSNSLDECELADTDNSTYYNNRYIARYFKSSDVNYEVTLNKGSVAFLKLPSTAKKILWAALYWQGHINNYSYQYSNTSTTTDDGYDYYYAQRSDDKKYYYYYERYCSCPYYVLSNDLPENSPSGIIYTNANVVDLKIGDGEYMAMMADKLFYKSDSRYFCNQINGCLEYKGEEDQHLDKFDKKQGVKYAAYKIMESDVIDTLNANIETIKNEGLPIQIANLMTTEGMDAKLGDYGAWSLVVVYSEDINNPDSKLRSINIYNGFESLYSSKQDLYITVDHLVLPHYGRVDSQMTVFAAEGEKANVGDYVKINDINLTEYAAEFDPDNVFDSYLSDDIYRIPMIQNNNGIDIDILDSSDALTITRDEDLNASEYSALIKVHTTNDGIFLGMIGFATELYQPRICYYIDTIKDGDTIIYQNGQFVDGAEIDPDKEYEVTVWFSNMKRSEDDENIEDADKVKIFMNMLKFDYTSNSTYMKNIGWSEYYHQTDEAGDDLFTFVADENLSKYNVGQNADKDEGGFIRVANSFYDNEDKAYARFKGFFVTDANEETINLDDVFSFKASFETQWIKVDEENAQEIPKCIPFDTEANVYVPPAGSFNVVEPTFNSDTDPLDPVDTRNEIYTKIVTKPFNMKVIKLDSTKEHTETFKGLVKVDVIKEPEEDEECNTTAAVWSQYVTFDNSESAEVSDVNVTKAMKKARFRVVFLTDGRGNIVEDANSACLSKTYNCIWGLLTQIASGRYGNSCPTGSVGNSSGNNDEYCDVPCAVECNYRRNRTQGGGDVPSEECLECIFGAYGESVCSRDNFAIRPDKFTISPMPNSMVAGKNYLYNVLAVDAENNPVADFNETLTVIKKGQSTNASPILEYNETKSNCIAGDYNPSTVLAFNDGQVNYNALYTEVGEVNVTIKEQSGKEFAIIDADDSVNPNGIAITPYVVTYKYRPDHFVVLYPSYTNGGNGYTYISNDLNMSSVLTFTIRAENANNNLVKNYDANCYAKDVSVNVSHSAVPISTNLIYKEHDVSIMHDTANTNNIQFTGIKNKFLNGSGNVKAYINFKKDYKTPVNPFSFTLNDINVSNTDGVNGSASVSQSAQFIYGRLNIPNVAGYATVLHNKIQYEFYKNGKWEVNNLHNSSSEGDINVTKSIVPGVTLIPGTITNGYQDLKYAAQKSPPFKTKGDYAISSWLWYHPKALNYQDPSVANLNCLTHPCNKISFLKVSDSWAGVGEQNSKYAPENNKTVQIKSRADVNVSKSMVKKLNW